MKQLKVGIPKGSLQESTMDMLERAGYTVDIRSRSYYPSVDAEHMKLRLIRPQDMSRYVEKGVVDCGLTGADWVAENESDVTVVTELVYAKQQLTPVRWVVAVPEDSPIQSVEDLEGKRISTELVNVTRNYLDERGINAEVEFSHGATETKAPDLVDAIVELTETGTSLRQNNLRIVEEVMESTTQFIACHESYQDEWKKKKITDLSRLLQSTITAKTKVGLKMNVPSDKVEDVVEMLPALGDPTVNTLAHKSGYAVEAVVNESETRELIPRLIRAGASGIIEYSLNKVVPC